MNKILLSMGLGSAASLMGFGSLDYLKPETKPAYKMGEFSGENERKAHGVKPLTKNQKKLKKKRGYC